MRVSVQGIRNTLRFAFELDESDGRYTESINMVEHTFSVTLPDGVTGEDVHPDHLALIALLVAHPFVGHLLEIPWEVSDRFAASCEKISKYNMVFEGKGGSSYQPTSDSKPALAFSGGADSTASLLVMPENTLSVFMNRPLKRKASMYNKSAALATVVFAQKTP